ncbi:MAG: excinuclease ABC subunit UvrB [Elusimicrobiaceae bacterium]|nr:excinuclease ABC subunit UvrB [Elusimicrobiaceae bacterium]
MGIFRLQAPFEPSGDQPAALDALCRNIEAGEQRQVLLGVTGSGKTYTMAQLIARTQRPALVISPNKVLAAQLYAEFKSYFPDNAVEYFISYYDYYQPEAYLPQTDTYIEKDADINDHIDKLRLKATTSLLSRPDTIVVASVSCIYNIGSPKNFEELCVYLKTGMTMSRAQLTARLTRIRYSRNDVSFEQGSFRARGGAIDIFPPYSQTAVRVELDGVAVKTICELQPLTGDILKKLDEAWVYPGKHFVSTDTEMNAALGAIETELKETLADLRARNKPLEAQRLEQRTKYDLEMLAQAGYCSGVENYSRHISGRPPGARPLCLMDYFYARQEKPGGENNKFLLFIDESHVTVPQVRGMYEGDRARKRTLVDFGFRLPSALDNRPLKFDEFEQLMPQTVFVSATPGPYELKQAGSSVSKSAEGGRLYTETDSIVELIIRPTGLVDPPVTVQPSRGQIAHLSAKIAEKTKHGQRTLVLSLTKKTAEDLAEFFTGKGIKAQYLHSDLDTLKRVEILKQFRDGEFDALVGINLLREGLDIPEVGLVAILGADNEGFLRSETTLIQISGRAARNAGGEVILYADRITGSMARALSEMNRRREKQQAYNRAHNITPASIIKASATLKEFQLEAKQSGLKILHGAGSGELPPPRALPALMKAVEAQMRQAADNLDFETAAALRDRLFELKELAVKFSPSKKGARQARGRKQ